MIFVTVGSMMAFDRLIVSMDKWADEHSGQDVLAQIGGGNYLPTKMRWTRMLAPNLFREAVREASVIVAHAGMGSFFVAMEMQKPIVMLPRIAANREHTTDHQLHTLRWLRSKPNVYAATSEGELGSAIDRAAKDDYASLGAFDKFASKELLVNIRQFLTQQDNVASIPMPGTIGQERR